MGGWREYLETDGEISYPWRSILENTIGPLGNSSPESRVTAFKQANSILSNLFIALRDETKYPSKAKMEEKLINCNANSIDSQHINDCAAEVFLGESGGPSYIPIGPGDGGAATLSGESIFGTPLAYPSQWKPGPDFYDSRLLKVAKCLVKEGHLSMSDTLESMGCDRAPATATPPTVASFSTSLTMLPTLYPTATSSTTASVSTSPTMSPTLYPTISTKSSKRSKSKSEKGSKKGTFAPTVTNSPKSSKSESIDKRSRNEWGEID